jgi:predicted permease
MGQLPHAIQDRPGSEPSVWLGADAWRSRYGSDPQIVGRSILINGVPASVIGIIPERSGFPTTASVWMPLGSMPNWTLDRATRPLRVIGRLQDDASEDRARREVEAIFGRFEALYPNSNRNVRARVVRLNDRVLGSLDGWMQFVYAGIIVILVACANVANLMIARALHRAPEIAIRTSLGASRSRVVGQLLIEATFIAIGGAVVGILVSMAGVGMVQAGIPDGILPYWLDYTMDRSVFLALVGVCTATIAIFGLLPALHASRTDVNRTLKDGGRSTTVALPLRFWTGAFLTVQLSLVMILLAQVAVATYVANQSIPTDRNINSREVMTAAVTLPDASYPDAARRKAFFAQLSERLRRRGEIVAHSRATILPGEGGAERRLVVRGQEDRQSATPPTVMAIEVAPQYFTTLGLSVLKGRDFSEAESGADRSVAIVNARFVETFLTGIDPIGAEIALTATNTASQAVPHWASIIGVAPTIRQQGARGVEQQSPVVYLPIAHSTPATSTVLVRHRVDAETAATILRTEAHAVDANIALYRMRTLERAVRDAQWNRHTSAVLADTVTFMSVLLAIVGLYAVTAQRVTLKTREIGLRMALGARSVQIAVMIVNGLRVPLLLGLLLGTAGAMAWDGVYSSGVAGVYASAPPTLLKIFAFIAAFVIVSCFVPVHRATHTSPVTALRNE